MSIRLRTWTTNGVEHKAWQVSYTDANGKRQRPQFKLKKDAEAFLNRAKTGHGRHPHRSRGQHHR